VQLAQNSGHVVFDRLLADVEPEGDLFVARTPGDHLQNLHLARRKGRVRIGRLLVLGVAVAPQPLLHPIDHFLVGHHLAVDDETAVVDSVDRVQQSFRRDVLGAVGRGPQPQGMKNLLGVVVAGQDDYLGLGQLIEDATRDAQAVGVGQVNVHQHDVGPKFQRAG